MLDEVVDVLACPHCAAGCQLVAGAVRCVHGHSFDIARQGYVNLAPGASAAGDSAAMVAARAEFLTRGNYEPLTERLTELVGTRTLAGPVVDVGAGTGHYLGRVLRQLPGGTGLALDVSKYACRRAAKVHPAVDAAVADTWHHIPVRDATASCVLDVFAPRNAAEIYRVLRPDGVLIVVTPRPGHLVELVRGLDLLTVDESKDERLHKQLGAQFEVVREIDCEFRMELAGSDAHALVAMGPTAWHVQQDELARRVAALAEPIDVTAAMRVGVYRPRHAGPVCRSGA